MSNEIIPFDLARQPIREELKLRTPGGVLKVAVEGNGVKVEGIWTGWEGRKEGGREKEKRRKGGRIRRKGKEGGRGRGKRKKNRKGV